MSQQMIELEDAHDQVYLWEIVGDLIFSAVYHHCHLYNCKIHKKTKDMKKNKRHEKHKNVYDFF